MLAILNHYKKSRDVVLSRTPRRRAYQYYIGGAATRQNGQIPPNHLPSDIGMVVYRRARVIGGHSRQVGTCVVGF